MKGAGILSELGERLVRHHRGQDLGEILLMHVSLVPILPALPISPTISSSSRELSVDDDYRYNVDRGRQTAIVCCL